MFKTRTVQFTVHLEFKDHGKTLLKHIKQNEFDENDATFKSVITNKCQVQFSNKSDT